MQLIDTHCHIHETAYDLNGDNPTRALWLKAGKPNPDDIITRAVQADVTGMICVGTSAADSQLAVDFVQDRPNCWASIGIHPHEAKDGKPAFKRLKALLASRKSKPIRQPGVAAGGASPKNSFLYPEKILGEAGRQDPRTAHPDKIVAIGECGLDYFYSHSPKADQLKALRFQIELALEHDLPLIFHVREAFDDFWPIFDSYQGIRGVLHSFTDTQANADKAIERNLYIGLNGIMTFTKSDIQLAMAKRIPLQKLLLETDAPYLTPAPHRGSINEPARTRVVAEFLATLRDESLVDLAAQTTRNARELFHL